MPRLPFRSAGPWSIRLAAGVLFAALGPQPLAAAPEPEVPEIVPAAPAPSDSADPAAPGNPAGTPAAVTPAPEVAPAPAVAPAPVADTGVKAAGPSRAAPEEASAPDILAPTGEEDIIVEVDPRQSRNRDRSLPLAMFLSAALPGAGEIYLNEKPQAKAFLLTEAGFWAALYGAFVARDAYLSSARNYASQYAGIDASRKSSAFLETMANYRSYLEKQHRQDSYELAQILAGKRNGDYPIKPEESNYWDFGSSVNPENTDHWNTFQSTLRYYRASKVAISFAIGALALNRLASLANTLRVYKHTSAQGLGLNVTPEFGPESAGSRITLSF